MIDEEGINKMLFEDNVEVILGEWRLFFTSDHDLAAMLNKDILETETLTAANKKMMGSSYHSYFNDIAGVDSTQSTRKPDHNSEDVFAPQEVLTHYTQVTDAMILENVVLLRESSFLCEYRNMKEGEVKKLVSQNIIKVTHKEFGNTFIKKIFGWDVRKEQQC